MASALTFVMRQGGFAIGIALLGAARGGERAPEAYAALFLWATLSIAIGATAAVVLLPKSGKLV